ncbi:MAG: hypothetical protein AB8F78_01880 [Saprospiraceae bacterium]
MSYSLKVVVVFGLLFFWSACEKDEMGPYLDADLYSIVDAGIFELLQESIDQLPYNGVDSISFVDEDMNILVFRISVSPASAFLISDTQYDVNIPGDTVLFKYGAEVRFLDLVNDSLNLRFGVNLYASTFGKESYKPTKVADLMKIWFIQYGEPRVSGLVLEDYINLRTSEIVPDTIIYEDVEYYGREFKDAFCTPFEDPVSYVCFNYEIGIISFTDLDGKLWVYSD